MKKFQYERQKGSHPGEDKNWTEYLGEIQMTQKKVLI